MDVVVPALPPTRSGARRRRGRAVVALVVVAGLGLVACSNEPGFDREQAIRDVLALDSRIDRSQAECYVDRVAEELGPGSLTTDSSVPPEQISKRTSIRVDCIGVANLGTDPPTTAAGPRERVPGDTRPNGPGDDGVLDGLYRSCAAGDGAACDRLFDAAPLGSEYERFASTCGDRTKELRCADVYPSPTGSTTTVAR